MNRRHTLVGVLAVTVAVMAIASQPSIAQDSSEATIQALETRVAELEETIDAANTPTTTASMQGEVTIDQFPGLFGVPPDELPVAEDGAVAVVVDGVYASYSEDSRAVVIHNNTSDAVSLSDVRATVRDAQEQLSGAATNAFLAVYNLPPQAYTVGVVRFGSDVAPEDEVTYEVLMDADATGYPTFHVALDVVEYGKLPSTFVGTVRNQYDNVIELAGVNVFCFDESGAPVDSATAWIISEDLDPGEEFTFETEDLGQDFENGCPYFLILASGMNWHE